MSWPNTRSFVEQLEKWTLEESFDSLDVGNVASGANYLTMFDVIEYVSKHAFGDYVPTAGPFPEFPVRLRDWLSNVESEEQQRVLFKLVPFLLYITKEHLNGLCRAAFNGPFARHALRDLDRGASFDREAVDQTLANVIDKTWFCSITDSMDIANFYHVNQIEGRWYRPVWMTLHKLGSKTKILEYLKKRDIQHIVLLEDFVGSGSQMADPVDFVASLSENVRVLLTPLIICPAGIAKGRALANRHANLEFEPVLALEKHMFVSPQPSESEPAVFGELRALLEVSFAQVCGANPPLSEKDKPYTPFGYRRTGGTVVLFTNTPDNTVPIVHHSSSDWSPLFPRSARW